MVCVYVHMTEGRGGNTSMLLLVALEINESIVVNVRFWLCDDASVILAQANASMYAHQLRYTLLAFFNQRSK